MQIDKDTLINITELIKEKKGDKHLLSHEGLQHHSLKVLPGYFIIVGQTEEGTVIATLLDHNDLPLCFVMEPRPGDPYPSAEGIRSIGDPCTYGLSNYRYAFVQKKNGQYGVALLRKSTYVALSFEAKSEPVAV